MINKILKELDRMIEIQQRSADRAEQMSNDVATYLEYKELAAYLKVQDMIKKCAQEAATSEGTDVNTQEKYNTDSGKSEIRKLVCDILNTILGFLEDENGFVKEARSRGIVPDFRFEFSGIASSLEVDLHQDGVSIFHLYRYLDGGFNLNAKEDTVNSLKTARQNLVATLKEVEE